MNASVKNDFKKITTFNKAVNHLKQHKAASISLLILIILTLASLFSNYISGYNPSTHGDLILDRYAAPCTEHLFGTDKFGRDILSRVLFGGRISLLIAFSVVILSSAIGLVYGMVSAYFGGKTDQIMMRFLDFLLAFPIIFSKSSICELLYILNLE